MNGDVGFPNEKRKLSIVIGPHIHIEDRTIVFSSGCTYKKVTNYIETYLKCKRVVLSRLGEHETMRAKHWRS